MMKKIGVVTLGLILGLFASPSNTPAQTPEGNSWPDAVSDAKLLAAIGDEDTDLFESLVPGFAQFDESARESIRSASPILRRRTLKLDDRKVIVAAIRLDSSVGLPAAAVRCRLMTVFERGADGPSVVARKDVCRSGHSSVELTDVAIRLTPHIPLLLVKSESSTNRLDDYSTHVEYQLFRFDRGQFQEVLTFERWRAYAKAAAAKEDVLTCTDSEFRSVELDEVLGAAPAVRNGGNRDEDPLALTVSTFCRGGSQVLSFTRLWKWDGANFKEVPLAEFQEYPPQLGGPAKPQTENGDKGAKHESGSE